MKTTVSGIIAALASFFALVAIAPPELQNQIPQLFPEAYRGRITIALGIVALIARTYQSQNTRDAGSRPGPDETRLPQQPVANDFKPQ